MACVEGAGMAFECWGDGIWSNGLERNRRHGRYRDTARRGALRWRQQKRAGDAGPLVQVTSSCCPTATRRTLERILGGVDGQDQVVAGIPAHADGVEVHGNFPLPNAEKAADANDDRGDLAILAEDDLIYVA